MNHKSLVSLALITLLFAACQQDKGITIVHKDKIVSLFFNGKERLSGLSPAYQEMSAAPLLKEMNGELLDYEWADGKTSILQVQIKDNNILFSGAYSMETEPENFYGCFFNSIPDFKQGMSIWRFKPWNSWSKPVPVPCLDSLPDWDVQLFYWQYEDGLYGAAIPLNDKGYRSTIGREGNSFGAKSVSYATTKEKGMMLQMIVGFGEDPYALFKNLYQDAMSAMNSTENLVEKKKYPETLEYLGWCTWNALDMGRSMSEERVIQGVESFYDKGIRLGWLIIDDGWQDNTNQKLNAFTPDKQKFPNGFKKMNETLKSRFGMHGVGIWDAFDGHWKGINPDSPLGKEYDGKLFSWKQRGPLDDFTEECFFIRPDINNALENFYNDWIAYQKSEGFTFAKVDNQLIVERMAVNNYPIDYLSKRMHKTLYNALSKHMDGTAINCMDMTTEAYFNFGNSAVARAVEDYFPEEDGGIGYNMERGGAAAHLIMALYNNLYFSLMAYTDFDMFESKNRDAYFHAFTRAANNGPIYLTDKPGQQNIDVIRPLTYSDGRLIRPQAALTLTEDCLFQGQAPKPVKAFSKNKYASILCIWNMSDADIVSGEFSPKDIYQLEGNDFVIYEYFTRKIQEVKHKDVLPVVLNRMGYAMYHVVPKGDICTPLGLTDKYNVSGTIADQHYSNNSLEVTIADGGIFAAYAETKPSEILVNSKKTEFTYVDNLITIDIPVSSSRIAHTISIVR